MTKPLPAQSSYRYRKREARKAEVKAAPRKGRPAKRTKAIRKRDEKP